MFVVKMPERLGYDQFIPDRLQLFQLFLWSPGPLPQRLVSPASVLPISSSMRFWRIISMPLFLKASCNL